MLDVVWFWVVHVTLSRAARSVRHGLVESLVGGDREVEFLLDVGVLRCGLCYEIY